MSVATATARPVVIDTNIALDVLVFDDPDGACLRAALEAGALHWLTTAGMRAELARVLDYPHIAPRLSFHARTPDQVLADFDALACCVPPAPRARAICRDPDDQPFIDLAAAHGALLLSKDRAVLALKKRLPAPVLTARAAIKSGVWA